MKFLTAALLSTSLIASSAFAGNLTAPVMEEQIIIEEASTSSASGWLIPVFALLLFAAAVSGSDSVPAPTGPSLPIPLP